MRASLECRRDSEVKRKRSGDEQEVSIRGCEPLSDVRPEPLLLDEFAVHVEFEQDVVRKDRAHASRAAEGRPVGLCERRAYDGRYSPKGVEVGVSDPRERVQDVVWLGLRVPDDSRVGECLNGQRFEFDREPPEDVTFVEYLCDRRSESRVGLEEIAPCVGQFVRSSVLVDVSIVDEGVDGPVNSSP